MRHVTVQQLSAFLDGALAGVSRDLVTRHLAACADCRERHALWHIYDEVLQRVLSWEPNDRTMEEASARVELTLTAERRGLPPPEFTSVLQPVIASTPDPRVPTSPSGVFPALPPIAAAAAAAVPAPAPATSQPVTSQPPPSPPPPPPPPPVAAVAAHSAVAPPPAPSPPPSPPPVPWSPPPPWMTAVSTGYPAQPGAPPPAAHAPYAPPPAAHAPYAPPPPGPPSGATSSSMSFPLDPPAGYPAQPGPAPPVGYPGYAAQPGPSRFMPPAYPAQPGPAPVRPVSPARSAGYDEPSVWASVPLPKQRKKRHRLLTACAVLLAAIVLATPWMPDVIRIQLPASYEPRVPRVEIVPHGKDPAPLDPKLHLAERTSSAPPSQPYRALPAPAESAEARATEVESVAATAAVVPPPVDERVNPPVVETAPAAEPSGHPAERLSPNPPPRNPDVASGHPAQPGPPARAVTAPEHRTTKKPAPPARKPAPAPVRSRTTPPIATKPEDEGGTAAGAENSMTFVPVQVKTEVRLSPTQPTATAPPAAADTAGDAAMPLLCGEVVDETGAPIEGARVQLTAPPLTVRTDKRGRFCVACPAGERTFLVDAPGFTPVTRGVELTGATFETHVSLSPTH